MIWISVYIFKVKVRFMVEICFIEYMKFVKLGIIIGRCIIVLVIGIIVEENDEVKVEYRYEVLFFMRF